MDRMPSLRPLPLALVAPARALQLAIGKEVAQVARRALPARTHLDAARTLDFISIGRGDIQRLDGDGDGRACE